MHMLGLLRFFWHLCDKESNFSLFFENTSFSEFAGSNCTLLYIFQKVIILYYEFTEKLNTN